MCNYVNSPQVMTGKKLLVNLSRDLARLKGKGFSRSNLVYMRKSYLAFPKSETLSHQLTWSHYFELPKCDDPLEMQFNASLFHRLALSTDKEGVLALANVGNKQKGMIIL